MVLTVLLPVITLLHVPFTPVFHTGEVQNSPWIFTAFWLCLKIPNKINGCTIMGSFAKSVNDKLLTELFAHLTRRSLDSGTYLKDCLYHQISPVAVNPHDSPGTCPSVCLQKNPEVFFLIFLLAFHIWNSCPWKAFLLSLSFRLSNSQFLFKFSILVSLNFSLPLLRASLLKAYICCTFHFAKLHLFSLIFVV